MRRRRILGFTAVAGFAFLVWHGIAAAQAQGQAAGTPDATAGLTRQVNLTPQEQLAQSDALLARMEGSRTVVRQALEKARTARDVVKTLCLNDKMNQLDVALRSARERRDALAAAASRSDGDLSSHEFTILSVLRQRSDQLTAEAQQCIGSEVGTVGDNNVSFTVEQGIAPDTSVFSGPGSDVIVEPPTCASCFQ